MKPVRVGKQDQIDTLRAEFVRLSEQTEAMRVAVNNRNEDFDKILADRNSLREQLAEVHKVRDDIESKALDYMGAEAAAAIERAYREAYIKGHADACGVHWELCWMHSTAKADADRLRGNT